MNEAIHMLFKIKTYESYLDASWCVTVLLQLSKISKI